MKKIFPSVTLFLFSTLHPTAPHDFKTAYTQTKQTLTYPAFLIRVANNAKAPLDARKAACDELLTRDDLSPDNALDVIISLFALKTVHQKFDEQDPAELAWAIIEFFEQSSALPVPTWTKVIIEAAKEPLSKISPGTPREDLAPIVNPFVEIVLKSLVEEHKSEISQFLANSNIYTCRAMLSPCHTLEACDPVYSCGAEERFYNQL